MAIVNGWDDTWSETMTYEFKRKVIEEKRTGKNRVQQVNATACITESKY